MKTKESRAALLARIDRLETALARESRGYQAMAEWFRCETKGSATTSLDVDVSGDCVASGTRTLRVTIHGISRAAGGVCVVEQVGDDWRDHPRYLDDLYSEWAHDGAREIREAARLLLARREQYCKVAS